MRETAMKAKASSARSILPSDMSVDELSGALTRDGGMASPIAMTISGAAAGYSGDMRNSR